MKTGGFMKIKLFTHTDLDGIGCAILTFLAYGGRNVDVEYCNYTGYNAINEKFEEFLKWHNVDEYDKIFITDISITEELAIEAEYEGLKDKLILLDHHKTALGLSKFDWVNVYVDEENPKSGVMLVYEYLEMEWIQNKNELLATKEEIDIYMNKLEAFSTLVSEYDTWLWNKNNNITPKRLNDLFKILGKDKFIDKIISHVESPNTISIFTDTDKLLLNLEQDKIDKYIWKKEKNMRVESRFGLEMGIIFAEQYISELGNKICENHPKIDAIAIINPDYGVSFRAIKDDIDVSEIAKKLGGGGHLKASGSPIAPHKVDTFIDSVLAR